ncbi:hypothetical protein LR48_Vigan05g142300 [Vigna angularis]|uniref:TIR domain-containing protein n=1 Tax=Phaseolus angularis TaxID=3914 RepID=A0A0L9UM30_PHAAN|nr:hypothetical protein LR48_Vigan05g142300 [Vigna angularis]
METKPGLKRFWDRFGGRSSGSTSSSSYDSSDSIQNQNYVYDVFISFGGPDTRNSFVDHLCSHLLRKGIFVFKDDHNLQKGESISPQLLEAIQLSRLSIIVFSKNYASSTWCLDEMTAIASCKQQSSQIVFPIFYDVDPSHVRHQNGVYENDFVSHRCKFQKDRDKVPGWERAMTDLANSAGWDVRDNAIKTHSHSFCMQLPSVTLEHSKTLVKSKWQQLLKGSRMVITTTDMHILKVYEGGVIHKVPLLNDNDARELFCRKAFKSEEQSSSCEALIPEVLKYAQCLPLAIRVLGSFLCTRDAVEWRDVLNRLQRERVDYVKRILDCCELYPHIGISRLVEKSLITISNEEIHMHELLQELGKKMVWDQSPQEPRFWSRIWLHKDFLQVLTAETGTEKVKAIVLNKEEEMSECSIGGLSRMKELTLLILYHTKVSGSLEFLSDRLRYLLWHDYPFDSLPPYFTVSNLVELNMPNSHIISLWHGNKGDHCNDKDDRTDHMTRQENKDEEDKELALETSVVRRRSKRRSRSAGYRLKLRRRVAAMVDGRGDWLHWYLFDVSNKKGFNDVYGFIDPSMTHERNKFDDIQTYITSCFAMGKEIYFLPYIHGCHWQLLVISIPENTAVWFCSLHKSPPNPLRHVVDCSLATHMMLSGRSTATAKKLAWVSLKSCPNLKRIDLSNSKYLTETPDFSRIIKLERLDLSGCTTHQIFTSSNCENGSPVDGALHLNAFIEL